MKSIWSGLEIYNKNKIVYTPFLSNFGNDRTVNAIQCTWFFGNIVFIFNANIFRMILHIIFLTTNTILFECFSIIWDTFKNYFQQIQLFWKFVQNFMQLNDIQAGRTKFLNGTAFVLILLHHQFDFVFRIKKVVDHAIFFVIHLSCLNTYLFKHSLIDKGKDFLSEVFICKEVPFMS